MVKLAQPISVKGKPITVHGRKFTGRVVSTRMAKTVSVERERLVYLPKYERYEKRRTRIKAHVPEGMTVEEGDIVTIYETRPLSKTKNFIVLENHTRKISLIQPEDA